MTRSALARTLVLAAGLTLTASSALAAYGLNLSWSDCGTFGALERNFACTSNSGANTMVASGISGTPLDQLNGVIAVVDLQTNGASLSAWWQIGSCRPSTVLSLSFDFSSSVNCLSPWPGSELGGVTYTTGFGGANRARIRASGAIPGTTAIDGTDEYYFFKVTFANVRTVGNGSCAGCTEGACFFLTWVTLTQPAAVGDYFLASPIDRQFVLWQGGSAGGAQGCTGATPVRPATWGALKSLYR